MSMRMLTAVRMATVLLCLVGFAIAYWVAVIHERSKAVSWLESQHAVIVYDYEKAGDASAPGPEWLRSLLGVDAVADVVEVYLLDSTDVKDLAPLASLTDIRMLVLMHCSGLNDLSALGRMTSLRSLTLVEMDVTDISPIGNLGNLEKLILVKQM